MGEDGATHQILEDIGMMKMLPNMTVIVPADYEQTRQATLAVAKHHGPVYLRFGRPKMPVFIQPEAPFEIGKIQKVISGDDVTRRMWTPRVGSGPSGTSPGQGWHPCRSRTYTIKPLDEASLVASAKKTGAVLVAEEHQRLGASAVSPKALSHITPPRWTLWPSRTSLEKAERLLN